MLRCCLSDLGIAYAIFVVAESNKMPSEIYIKSIKIYELLRNLKG